MKTLNINAIVNNANFETLPKGLDGSALNALAIPFEEMNRQVGALMNAENFCVAGENGLMDMVDIVHDFRKAAQFPMSLELVVVMHEAVKRTVQVPAVQ